MLLGTYSSTKVAFSLLLVFIFSLPYYNSWFQIVEPNHQDDLGRYLLYAKNMYNESTLWGGDELFFKEAGKHFVSQPGYRYLLLLQILPDGELYRCVFLINIGLWVLGVGLFFSLFAQLKLPRILELGIVLLVLLSTPAMVKNILLGIPEWFTCFLLLFHLFLLIQSKSMQSTVVVLALVPFFRQNLLISVLLILMLLFYTRKIKLSALLVFLLVLFLPVYHNLYYADSLRYFVDVFEMPFAQADSNNNSTGLINSTFIFDNMLHYLGIESKNGSYLFSWVAILFLPLATFLYFVFLVHFKERFQKVLFLAISMATILPSLLFANAYYPRFELMNTYMIVVVFVLISWLFNADSELKVNDSNHANSQQDLASN